MKSPRILVVGGAGYIGGTVTDALMNYRRDAYDPFTISVFDALWFAPFYFKQGINQVAVGDVRVEDFWKDINNFDVVIWLAGVVGDAACRVDPNLTKEVNVDVVKRLAQEYKGRIIFASTCSVYGFQNGILDEESTLNPLSLYAETKVQCEHLLRAAAPDRTTIFRLGTIFGAGDAYTRPRLDLVLNAMVREAMFTGEVLVGAQEQYRPLIHVTDAGYAFASSAIHAMKDSDNWKTGVFNLHSVNMTMHDLGEKVVELIPNSKIKVIPAVTEDNRSYQVTSDKARNELSFIPQVDVEEGIKQMYNILQVVPDPLMNLFNNHKHQQDLYNAGLR